MGGYLETCSATPLQETVGVLKRLGHVRPHVRILYRRVRLHVRILYRRVRLGVDMRRRVRLSVGVRCHVRVSVRIRHRSPRRVRARVRIDGRMRPLRGRLVGATGCEARVRAGDLSP